MERGPTPAELANRHLFQAELQLARERLATGAGNYPVRVANGLLGLGEGAQLLYLHLLDKWQGWTSAANETRCFMAAADYDDRVGATLDHILRFYFDLTPETRLDLIKFFVDRWRHNFMAEAS